jgi:hypothetical protein
MARIDRQKDFAKELKGATGFHLPAKSQGVPSFGCPRLTAKMEAPDMSLSVVSVMMTDSKKLTLRIT